MSHTTRSGQTTFVHDGGVEGGDLTILGPHHEITVPADDVIDFVLDEYLSGKIIEWLEQNNLRDVLGRRKRMRTLAKKVPRRTGEIGGRRGMSERTYEVTFKAVVTVHDEQAAGDTNPVEHDAALEDVATTMARELISRDDFEPYGEVLLLEVDGEPTS